MEKIVWFLTWGPCHEKTDDSTAKTSQSKTELEHSYISVIIKPRHQYFILEFCLDSAPEGMVNIYFSSRARTL